MIEPESLCEQVGQTFHLFPILFGLWRFYLLRANFDVARDLGEKLLSLVQHGGHVPFLLDAYFALGAPSFWRGDFNLAHENFEQVIVYFTILKNTTITHFYSVRTPCLSVCVMMPLPNGCWDTLINPLKKFKKWLPWLGGVTTHLAWPMPYLELP